LQRGSSFNGDDLSDELIDLMNELAGDISLSLKLIVETESRENAEKSLHLANVVVENSPAVLFRWKAEEGWPVDYVSQNVAQFGYTPQELLSGETPYSNIIYPPDLERVSEEVKNYSEDGSLHFRQEYRLVTKSGKVLWTDDRTMVERDADGNINYYQGIILDITHQKLIESALWETQQMLNKVLDNIPQRIFWKDKNYNYLGCNRLFAKDAGLDFPDQILGKNDFELSWKDVAHLYRADDIEVVENGHVKINYDEIQERGDGETIWLRTSKLPLKDKNGEILGVLGCYEDITERKSADEALEESEKRYRNFVNQTSEGFYMLATEKPIDLGIDIEDQVSSFYKDFYVKECNDMFARMYGYNSAVEIMKTGLGELHGDSNIDKNINSFRKFLHSELKIIDAESIEYDKYGNQKYFLNNYIGIVENENLIEIWGTQKDITIEKNAENLLIQSEKQYRLLFSNNPNPMFVYDNKTLRFLDVNEVAVKHYGYSKEEFLNMTIKEIRPQEDIPELLKVLNRESEEIVHVKGYRHKKKNGDLIYVDITSSNILYNNRNCILVLVYDITEKYFAELALKESEDKFKSVFTDSHDCIYVTSPQGKILNMNKAGLNLFGIKQEQLLNYGANNLYKNKEERKKFQVDIDKQDFVKDYPVKLKTSQKKELDCLLTASVRRDSSNKIISYQGIIRDISEQKRAEKDLIEAKEQAEQADKLKTEFLAQMSHEIRTPINTLLSFSSLIREETETISNHNLDQYFNYQFNAGRRIIRTIDLILNMSEIQAGSFQTNMKELSIFDIVSELFNEYSTLAKNKGLEFSLSYKEKDMKINGDEYSVQQIFGNLIDNAIKYTHTGAIKINISHSEEYISVEVLDTGIGISEDYSSELFQPFTQEEQGYSRQFEGSGLGLALVKKYCDINNAKISVESKKNVGTSFRVSFKIL